MRNIINSVLLSTLLISSSCVDLLQEPKSNLTPQNIIWDTKTLNNNAEGLYLALRGGNYGYNCRIMWTNLAADDIISGNMFHTNTRALHRDNLLFNTTIFDEDVNTLYGKSFYAAVAQANLMIRDLSGSDNADEYLQYIAEAKFVRAFSYFNLVRLFGEVPGIIDPEQIDIYGSKDIKRNSIRDIYDMIIIPDLEYAIENLTLGGRNNVSTVASVDAARICLAEVYLTMAQWPLKLGAEYYTKAKDMATEVINSPQGYSLLPEYGDLWLESTKQNRTEHIFAINHGNGNGYFSNYGTSYANRLENSGAWQDYLADSLFFENYPADKRRDFNYVSAFRGSGPQSKKKLSFRKATQNPGLQSGMRAPGIKKYEDYGPRGADGKPNNSGAQTYGITPVYRLADAYFFYAEAQTMGGVIAPDQNSVSYINAIRRRAYRAYGFSSAIETDVNSPNFYLNRIMDDSMDGIESKPANLDLASHELTAEGFIQALYNERGWEFFSEFKRWFELVRTERVAEVNKPNRRVDQGNIQGTNCYLLPLPMDEVSRNLWSNNPGW